VKLFYSKHWEKKRGKRKSILHEQIEFAIHNSNVLKDKHWEDALNAICRVPSHGRILKVVYKKEKGKYKIITAFYLD
jgi:hypothetical protein